MSSVYPDFHFTFDPSLSNIFPNTPQLPSSADLFDPAETADLFNFLNGFENNSWDSDPLPFNTTTTTTPRHQVHSVAPYSNPHLDSAPESSSRPRRSTRAAARPSSSRSISKASSSSTSDSSSVTPPAQFSRLEIDDPPSTRSAITAAATARAKPLLSSPQKRLNHIMSEQKRRNAIRDGYAQLIALLAPAGSAPGIGMPTRGRPKGSGSRGKGASKGKSGVLFRAVEYCRWLEEGRDALRKEVLRLEGAAGISRSS